MRDHVCFMLPLALLLLQAAPAVPWRPPAAPKVQIAREPKDTWKVVTAAEDEFTLDSIESYPVHPGDYFEVNLRVRVDLHTRALPELASYDAAGREIPTPSALATGPSTSTTNWQTFHRIFAPQPGAAQVRARIRADGRGEFRLADLQFRPRKIDPYQTGALISQIYPRNRRGLVIESNLNIVNAGRISKEDRDGDGKWALILVNLDRISEPEEKGVDWRTKFEYRPNEIYWSDGAVLKSDSVPADRPPDPNQALHFRTHLHPGSYRVILNDPGRAVAISRDGKIWKRYAGGEEAELGMFDAYFLKHKPVVEATFGAINTLFCQHVASYTGSNTTLRGADVTGAWTLPELQELLDEWLLAGWQTRPHDALRDPLAPRRMLSPNEKYAALVAAAGYLPLTLTGEDYLELLPVEWRQINAYGIRIGYRTYDCTELGAYRLQHSGVTARRGLWEVHYDPYDATKVFLRTPDGWVTVPWTHLPMVSAPFAEFTWRHARKLAAQRGVDDTNETEVAKVLDDLLTRAQAGPVDKASDRVAARTRVAATAHRPPAHDEPSGKSEPAGRAEPDGPPAAVIPCGVFDADAAAATMVSTPARASSRARTSR